jgi:hypothetical protein
VFEDLPDRQSIGHVGHHAERPSATAALETRVPHREDAWRVGAAQQRDAADGALDVGGSAIELIERVLPPESGLRQWVLTSPFSWRRRLAQDAGLLGRRTRIVVETVLTSYAARAAPEGRLGAKSGAVTVVQRTSSDLRLNPHLHLVVLDGPPG